MTWIRTIPVSQGDEKLRQAMEGQKSLYPKEYATPVHPTEGGGAMITESHSLIPEALYHAFATFGVLMSPDAHAYLLDPDGHELTQEARARLATLADHTELGAGFAIAMRDLEIRGAGDLLGAEQSGHVAAIGFELYVELLAEAVAELRGTRRAAGRPVRVEAQVDAYVPADYIRGEAQKIDLHGGSRSPSRRTSCGSSAPPRKTVRPGPEPVEHLFEIQEAKLKLARLGADYLVFRSGRTVIGPLVLGSAELRGLRALVDTAVYSSAQSEVTLRGDGFKTALRLVDAILDLRLAA